MKELVEILDAIERFARSGEPMALATIVGVRGSTYRREGARLLLTRSQQMVGNISGGCLESDVMVVADEVMRTGRPRVVTYDLTADDDVVWGLGLGCNGAVDIFIEPVDPSQEVFGLYRRALAEETPLAVVTALSGETAGARLALWPDGRRVGTLGDPDLDERVAQAAAAALRDGSSRVHGFPAAAGQVDCFVEVVRPPLRLVVCGAGHDAIPLVQLASALGWRVVVADSRERFLTPQRFPGARQFVRADPAETAARVPVDRGTYVVIMTHNYLHDRDLLRGFLRTEVPYIGVLGPRIRTEKILADLRREGVPVTDDDLARIYGPVGLDVGADTPEEIALAVVAEIQAVRSGRRAGFLRDRAGPIHAPAPPTRVPGGAA